MSIDIWMFQLYYMPRPSLVRHSSVSDPIQGNLVLWRCPYNHYLFSKKRMHQNKFF